MHLWKRFNQSINQSINIYLTRVTLVSDISYLNTGSYAIYSMHFLVYSKRSQSVKSDIGNQSSQSISIAD